MEIKETPDLWVLRKKKRLRIPDVKQYAAEYAAKIDAEITDAGLEIDGPWLFISRNLPKDSKTFFDWEICRPVKKTERYEGKLELVHLEPIMVATKVHQGSLRTLFTKGYAPLIAEMDMSRYIYSGESREIYHGWNGPGAPYHHIEIQFGLAR
ncbi:hypothetical protein [Peteryoungia ipomoeae]|uniref:Uncharacterized protein n=1 Tax=Peteryoungia ipomoeae TaxID=1210932 RepID=A0A4S8NRF3_9HYPH|nr:hypothetical protein [Peteryoungia ipomoeae]THV19830.1 hypothetical protein FAA97_20395 [Peteryoungia ipomoeae]